MTNPNHWTDVTEFVGSLEVGMIAWIVDAGWRVWRVRIVKTIQRSVGRGYWVDVKITNPRMNDLIITMRVVSFEECRLFKDELSAIECALLSKMST